MRRSWLVAVLTAGVGLALAGNSEAKTSHHRLKCGHGYVLGSVRVAERKDGRIVRRHGQVVYTRVQRCVKVDKPKPPTTVTPQPIPGGSGTPVATPPAGTTTTTTPSTTSTTTTSQSPPPPPSKDNPCTTPMPGYTLQLGRTYSLAGEDTFTKDAPVGSFAQNNVPDANNLQPIYTGDHGMGWSVYPDGWTSTYTKRYVLEGYQPSTVLSVHDGVLDFYLHDDANGNPVGADVSPWPGGNEYQTYGAYSFCEKVVPTVGSDLADFYEASLLWPQSDSDGSCAESDFPETYSPVYDPLTNPFLNGGNLDNQEIYAFAHYSPWNAQTGCQQTNTPAPDSWNTPIDLSQWHVFTQEWGPGYRSYYIDGKYVYTSTNQVWWQPERWQLQMEPSPAAHLRNDGGTGHVYIAWLWIGKPD